MAKLIKCKACGADVSNAAPTCPNCGNPIKRKSIGCLSGIIIIFLVIGVFSLVNNHINPPARVSSSNVSPSSSSPKPPPKPKVKEPGSQWSYHQSEDDMAPGGVFFASVSSSNTVDFSFPYSGEQHGTLALRTHPRYGKDLIFKIEKGQILCNSYDGCEVLVRFDDGQASRFKAFPPKDNSTETVFISDYRAFVGKMLQAKRVRISVDVYQQGNPVFDFDVSHFSQSKYLPKG